MSKEVRVYINDAVFGTDEGGKNIRIDKKDNDEWEFVYTYPFSRNYATNINTLGIVLDRLEEFRLDGYDVRFNKDGKSNRAIK